MLELSAGKITIIIVNERMSAKTWGVPGKLRGVRVTVVTEPRCLNPTLALSVQRQDVWIPLLRSQEDAKMSKTYSCISCWKPRELEEHSLLGRMVKATVFQTILKGGELTVLRLRLTVVSVLENSDHSQGETWVLCGWWPWHLRCPQQNMKLSSMWHRGVSVLFLKIYSFC